MLLNSFFTIDSIEQNDKDINGSISLNVEHPIYRGHFPSQPVVPGVCMMQIIAELVTAALGKELSIKKAHQAKFLIPIIPNKTPKLAIKINYSELKEGQLKVTGSIYKEALIFFKFKGVLA